VVKAAAVTLLAAAQLIFPEVQAAFLSLVALPDGHIQLASDNQRRPILEAAAAARGQALQQTPFLEQAAALVATWTQSFHRQAQHIRMQLGLVDQPEQQERLVMLVALALLGLSSLKNITTGDDYAHKIRNNRWHQRHQRHRI
jgi:hypothetical protein